MYHFKFPSTIQETSNLFTLLPTLFAVYSESESVVRSVIPLFATPWTIQSMEFSRLEYWSGQPFLSPGDLSNPGFEPRSPALQADSLSAKPQGKPKNTGVGSLYLLQCIFPTQESNWDLLHCRRLSYQRSTVYMIISILQCIKWCLIVILFCFSVIGNDAEHIFLYTLVISIDISSLEKYIFIPFAQF